MKEPLMVPALTDEQPTGEESTGVPLMSEAGHESAALKLVPVTEIDAPTVPEVGFRAT
jgi:hypothetical protein